MQDLTLIPHDNLSLLGVEDPYMSDYFDIISVLKCPKTDDLNSRPTTLVIIIWGGPAGTMFLISCIHKMSCSLRN